MKMNGFMLYPTIKDRELEKLLNENLGEDFEDIASMIDHEFQNDSYIPLFFEAGGKVILREAYGYETEEELEEIRKINLACKFLFNLFGDKFDRVLVDVSW